MSGTTVLFVILGILLALLLACTLLFVFSVELLRKLLRRTPLAPFVSPRGTRGTYGTFADDGD